MDFGPHAAFIVAAYSVSAAVVAGLVLWVLADHQRQIRILADLEARGVKRRSDPAQQAAQ